MTDPERERILEGRLWERDAAAALSTIRRALDDATAKVYGR